MMSDKAELNDFTFSKTLVLKKEILVLRVTRHWSDVMSHIDQCPGANESPFVFVLCYLLLSDPLKKFLPRNERKED